MRLVLIVCAAVGLAACSAGSTAPSSVSAGTTLSLAGTWSGTLASSNNDTEPITIVVTQSGSDVRGTWQGMSVSWTGNVTGSVDASTFDGQFTFSGTAANGTVCTGTAAVTGPATSSSMTLTSAAGVVGAACPAPLPLAITIDVRRQS